MSYYRDVYLRSSDWQTLRLAAIHLAHNKCTLCRRDDVTLDAHHLQYKRLVDTCVHDLRVLCRECHDKVHELLDKYPKLKSLPPVNQWKVVLFHLTDNRKFLLRKEPPPSPLRDAINAKRKRRHRWKQIQKFRLSRKVLCTLGLAKRKRMKWSEKLAHLATYKMSPIEYLKLYMSVTGVDPRYRIDRIGPQKLLTFPTKRTGMMKWKAW